MWYRTGLLAVLSIRKMDGINFGFVPKRLDWAVGLRNFVYFLPLGLLLGYALDFFRLRTSLGWMQLAVFLVTFVVTLCGLALAEEFFFRGLLQQVLTRISGREWIGLLAASRLFRPDARLQGTVSELALCCAGNLRRRFLRAGIHSSPKHPSGDGDTRTCCERMESLPDLSMDVTGPRRL